MTSQFSHIVSSLSDMAARAARVEAAGRADLIAAPTVSAMQPGATHGCDIFFGVEKMPLSLVGPDGNALANRSGAKLPQHCATIRTDLGVPVVLGVVSPGYHIVPMEQVVTSAEAGLRSVLGDKFDEAKVRDRASHGGARVYREYSIPTGDEIPQDRRARKVGTTVALQVVIGNSYDGSSTVSLMAGTLDLVCTNGMLGFNVADRSSMRHSLSAVGYDWSKVIERAFAAYREDVRRARVWAQTPISEAEARSRLERLGLGPRSLEAMVMQFRIEADNRGSSLWALASAITHDATHSSMRNTGVDHAATTLFLRQTQAASMIRRVVERV